MDFDFENYEENFDNNGNNGNDGNAEKQIMCPICGRPMTNSNGDIHVVDIKMKIINVISVWASNLVPTN